MDGSEANDEKSGKRRIQVKNAERLAPHSKNKTVHSDKRRRAHLKDASDKIQEGFAS
jgi:hypothetical protein